MEEGSLKKRGKESTEVQDKSTEGNTQETKRQRGPPVEYEEVRFEWFNLY